MATNHFYILRTRHGDGTESELAYYRGSSRAYQKAYDRVADIAERHGHKVTPGSDNVAIQTCCSETGQVWYVTRHNYEE